MKSLVGEGTALLYIASRTPSTSDRALKSTSRRAMRRVCSRGAAVPTGAISSHCALGYTEALQVATKRPFIASGGQLRRASVPNGPVSGVVVGGRPLRSRTSLIHEVLRFRQAGHCSSPRLARGNRDLTHRLPTGSSLAVGASQRESRSEGQVVRAHHLMTRASDEEVPPLAGGSVRATRGRSLPPANPSRSHARDESVQQVLRFWQSRNGESQ